MVSDFRQLAAKWDNVLEVAEQMNQREASLEQIVNTLELGNKEETQKKTIAAIIGELDKELEIIGETATGSLMDRFKRPVNGWALFNAVQGYYQHRRPSRGRKIQRNELEQAYHVAETHNVSANLESALLAV